MGCQGLTGGSLFTIGIAELLERDVMHKAGAQDGSGGPQSQPNAR